MQHLRSPNIMPLSRPNKKGILPLKPMQHATVNVGIYNCELPKLNTPPNKYNPVVLPAPSENFVHNPHQ